MESEEKVIIPQKQVLSVDELIKNREIKSCPVKSGLKKTIPDGSVAESDEIQKLHDNLRMNLSKTRVERVGARSIAEWNPFNKTVKLVKKRGKFHAFGYVDNEVEYLEHHEALFLIELNRLQLYFNSLLVSIEQAYHLLLGQEKSHKYDTYLVYSTLSRAGYIVQKYKSKKPRRNSQNVITAEDCIWEILQNTLNRNYKIPPKVQAFEKYETIKNSMQSIADKIRNQESSSTSASDNLFNIFGKRMHSGEGTSHASSSKRFKTEYVESYKSGSNLDFLKSLPEYEPFRNIFEKFDKIKLRDSKDYNRNCRRLPIDFDLYLPNSCTNKSKWNAPNCRVVVLGAEDRFPSRAELMRAYKSQNIRVPLLIISVSYSKHVQAVLYYFT